MGLALMVGLAISPNGSAQDAALPEFVPQGSNVKYITRTQLDSDVAIVKNVASREIQLQPLEKQATIPVVTALAATSTGAFLAAAGDDHAIRIIDAINGQVIKTVGGHTDWIQSLVFSNTEEQGEVPHLYSAGDDGLVLRWDQGKAYPTTIARMDFAIRSLSLSSQRQLLAIGGFGNLIVVCDLEQQNYKHVLKCDCSDQRCVRFSPDGSKLLCGGRDGAIAVWDSSTGERIAHYLAHQQRVFTASFSADGERITSVGNDRRLVQYDLGTQTLLPYSLELPAKLRSMSLINDRAVAIAGADNSIQLYDFRTGDVIADLREHTGSVAVMCPCGPSLASGAYDTTVRIWDLESIANMRANASRPVSFTPLDVDEELRIR